MAAASRRSTSDTRNDRELRLAQAGTVPGPRRTRAGALIETARLRADLSQQNLAALAHTSQAAISDYELGRKVPSLGTLERVLSAAGFDLLMSVAPAEDHDESLQRYVATLPKATRRRFEREQASRAVR